jgi:hypothetical protein
MNPSPTKGQPARRRIPETLHVHTWVNVAACPLCGSGRGFHRLFERVETDERPLIYKLCRTCGMVFQSPRPSDRSLRQYYEDVYHRHMMPDWEDVARNEWVLEHRAAHLAEFAREHIKDAPVLLDVGSSRGHVLAAFKAQYGSDAYAVEPGVEVQADVARHARHVVSEMDKLPDGLAGAIDLAVLSHVTEHLPAPMEFMVKLRRRWLHPGSWLLVEVPNLLWHSALELSHLTAFTAGTFKHMIEAAGYRIHRLEPHGHPYSHTFPLFLLALARPRQNPRRNTPFRVPSPVWWLRWRRRLNRRLYRLVQRLLQAVRGPASFRPWSE